MKRFSVATAIVAVAFTAWWGATRCGAQERTGFEGRWTLNRELSQFPREVGFTPNWMAGVRPAPENGAGRDPRGAGGSGAGALARPESEDEARRKQQLTSEVRTPPALLTITDTPAVFTITDDQGRTRTFHTDGRDETIEVDGVPVVVNARREPGRVIVSYKVQSGRELRYTLTRVPSPPQLVVEVQFLERGKGDLVKRVYEPARATDTRSTASAAATAPATTPAMPRPGAAEAGGPVPAIRPQAEPFDQRPDAALRDLNKLGLVVEDLSSQAAACGLNQAAIENAVAKQLSDAGLKVARNDDEDTYLYVNVITTSTSTGLCVSRYDTFLYSHATGTLSHQQTPVLLEVSLLHKGGITGGSAASHGQAVARGLQEFVDSFVTRIRDANK